MLHQIAMHGQTNFKWSQVVDWEQHKQFGGQEGGGGGEGQEEEIFTVCLLLTVSLIAKFLPNYFAVTESCYNQGFWNCWVLHRAVKTKLISSPLPHVPHSESRWELGHKYKGCFNIQFQSVVHHDPLTNKSSVHNSQTKTYCHQETKQNCQTSLCSGHITGRRQSLVLCSVNNSGWCHIISVVLSAHQ